MGEADNAFHLLCLNAADGKLLWKTMVEEVPGKGEKNERDYPGPRATPSTDGSLVITLAPYGSLVCVDAATGKEIWRKNFKSDFGGEIMTTWMYSESPLLDGDNVVCTPGGSKGTVIALKKSTGEQVWRSAGLADPAAYSSLVPAEIGGKKQYLVLTAAHVAGIDASSGTVLWKADRKGKIAVIPDPVYKDGIVFVGSGYGVGCNAFKISSGAGGFQAEEIYNSTKVMNHHGGILLIGDHLYELDDKELLKCIDMKTGNVVWEDKCVGKGSITYADGMLYCRSQGYPRNKPGPSSIALVEATPAGYKEKGRFEQPDRSTKAASWPHPVVIGGKLYIRDMDVLLCYDVKAK
jgi:outer membrane protein assembly factor BamB